MIVWGGVECLDGMGSPEVGGDTNSGAIYDVVSDSWTAMSVSGAPSPRYSSAAVWTGVKLIVWGGWNRLDETTLVSWGDGAIYTP